MTAPLRWARLSAAVISRIAWARFARPVRESCAAWWLSSAWAAARSAFAAWIWTMDRFIRAITRAKTATDPNTTAQTLGSTPSSGLDGQDRRARPARRRSAPRGDAG